MFEQKKKIKALIEGSAAKTIVDTMSPKEQKHILVCKAILRQAETFNAPIGIILYLGVGTNAHKSAIFERGYSKLPDYTKIKEVLSMAEIIAKKMDKPKLRTNCALIHFLSRYYDNGGKIGELRTYLALAKGVDLSALKNAKGWADVLLKGNDKVVLSPNGYYNGRVQA